MKLLRQHLESQYLARYRSGKMRYHITRPFLREILPSQNLAAKAARFPSPSWDLHTQTCSRARLRAEDYPSRCHQGPHEPGVSRSGQRCLRRSSRRRGPRRCQCHYLVGTRRVGLWYSVLRRGCWGNLGSGRRKVAARDQLVQPTRHLYLLAVHVLGCL